MSEEQPGSGDIITVHSGYLSTDSKWHTNTPLSGVNREKSKVLHSADHSTHSAERELPRACLLTRTDGPAAKQKQAKPEEET